MSLINISHLFKFSHDLRDQIVCLDRDFFSNPWSESSWEVVGEIEDEYLLSLAQAGDQIVGFALFKLNRYEDLSHLLKLLVMPDYRNLGIGETLLKSSYELLKTSRGVYKRYLEVSTRNLKAIALYKKLGFVELNRVKRFYSDGDDAVIMG